MKKSANNVLDSRGMDNHELIEKYRNHDFSGLVEKLNSSVPAERTAAARVLADHKTDECAFILSQALAKENKLYSKIAISESLGEIGIISLKYLLPLLGKIGTNQHKNIPDNKFHKKSFPLPRDIAARTITKTGEKALDPLEDFIRNEEDSAVSEALDAYGFIAFYGNKKRSSALLIKLFDRTQNMLIKWKIIRALESFVGNETVNLLESVLKDRTFTILHKEAERSLAQIKRTKEKKLFN